MSGRGVGGIMGTLRIADNLALPVEAVTQTFAILAKRGAGKTYTAAVMVEEMVKQRLPVIVADPVGVWWGLRVGADGHSAGLPVVIFGGDHGDLPLVPDAGEAIADLLVDEPTPAVLDLSLLRKGEQVRFMTAFAERLYHRNRAALHLVLDEADLFAPQRPMRGQERMLGAVEDLVRRGRARGIGVTLVTQRAAVLNKDVLTQIECLVVLRTISPQDRDAIDAWVRVHGTTEQREQLMASLPSLPVGTAWFWSPGWLNLFAQVRVRRRETFDSSSTPKVGESSHAPQRLSEIDLGRIQERLKGLIARAESEDPRVLRRRIAELERQLAASPTPARVVERVEVPVLDPDVVDRLREVVEQLRGPVETLGTILAEITAAVSRLATTSTRPVPAPRPVARPEPTAPAQAGPESVTQVMAGGVVLRAGERRMLATLARRHPLKLTRTQLGTLSGLTPSGGTFNTYLSILKRHGLVNEGTDGLLEITPAGFAYLGSNVPQAPSGPAEVLEIWRQALRAGERRMLDELVSAYPGWLTREELGRRTGIAHTGGTFGTYLSVLRRNGLVEVDGDRVRASETLFM